VPVVDVPVSETKPPCVVLQSLLHAHVGGARAARPGERKARSPRRDAASKNRGGKKKQRERESRADRGRRRRDE
jgi:hypothetical protein